MREEESMIKRNVFIILSLALVLATLVPRLRVNVSPSMMPTLLWVSDGPARRGDDVVFCAPEPVAALGVRKGYVERSRFRGCASGVMLFKRLVARPGDRIQVIEGEAPRVNGVAWGGVPPAVDSQGRWAPVRSIDRWLLPGECWVLGEIARSFDSRYFGPVPCAGLRKVRPIF